VHGHIYAQLAITHCIAKELYGETFSPEETDRNVLEHWLHVSAVLVRLGTQKEF
jgi:hypothetical protein